MIVYADHAATTPMRACAKEAVLEGMEITGNPSSIHQAGRIASMKLEGARKEVAELLNCRPSEIYFTSGGTEADNWALNNARHGGGCVVTSAFEHHAVLHTLDALLERSEIRHVQKVAPTIDGIMDPDAVALQVGAHTSLVTIMAANNEIGTIQPVAEIAKEAHKKKGSVIIHTDAVQAVGHIPVDLQKLGVDMLSLSAHKFGGPRGVGLLYCRSGITLDPLMFGGGQERGRRPSTENVPAIMGMAAAMREACENMDAAAARTRVLRDKLGETIMAIPGAHIHGTLASRLPGNINCSFDGVEGEAVVLMLDLAGVCVSAGSACTSGTGEPSHVLTALGLQRRDAYGAVRISLAETNTETEVEFIGSKLAEIVASLRGR